VGSAILRYVILLVAQAVAGVVALTAFIAATGADEEWARWQHIVASIGEHPVVFLLMLLMIRNGGDRIATMLKLRAAPLQAYPVTFFMVILTGPWHALIAQTIYGEPAAATLDFELNPTPVWLATVFMGAVLAPIVEEAIFRGYLFSLLEKRSALVAIVCSSIMFSLTHVNPVALWGFSVQLPIALALAICMARFRSLYPMIVAHGVWNLLIYLDLSPVHWFAPTALPLSISLLLFVLCAVAILRQSRSSLRV